MNYAEAIRLAEQAAKVHGQMHSYVVGAFVPHRWVIKAVQAAYAAGFRDAFHAD